MSPPPSDAPRQYREFFRPDQGGRFGRILLPALVLLTVGPPLILFSATMKQIHGHEVLGFVGALLMVGGLLTGFVGIGVMLKDDRYVAVVDEGLVLHDGAGEATHPWDTVAEVRADGADLIIALVEGEPVRFPFGRKDVSATAKRLDDWRRKSAWNLAPSSPP